MVGRDLQNDRGSALVELALVLPLLTLLLIGATELGRIAYYAIEVSSAARAGVAYGSQNGVTATCTSTDCAMKIAAADSAPDIKNMTFPTPPDGTNNPCVCETITTNTSGTTVTSIPINPCTSANAAKICSVSTVPGTTKLQVNYVELSTQAQISTMFHYPGIPTSFTLHGFAKMRQIEN